MRTLIPITVNNIKEGSSIDVEFKEFLKEKKDFHPMEINLDETIKEYIRLNLLVDNSKISNYYKLTLADQQTIDILSAIPLENGERSDAINTMKILIKHQDKHMNTVFGLVCIDEHSITVRFRHHLSRSLEQATENLVNHIWNESGPNKKFQYFQENQIIPVREPRSIHDTYQGEIISQDKQLYKQARNEKKIEYIIFIIFSSLTIICSCLGFYLFISSKSEESIRWVSGFFDRLATGAIVASLTAYFNFRFYINNLKKKQPIEWK